MMRQCVLLAGVLATFTPGAGAGAAGARSGMPGEAVTVNGVLSTEKDKKPRGVSGMACLKADATGARECLLVVDEEIHAERVRLVGDRIEAEKRTVRISREQKSDAGLLGARRVADCGDTKEKIDEFDGEGVAATESHLYVVGSHGCTGGGNYKHDAYMLARLTLTPDGLSVDMTKPVERSLRVADMLLASPASHGYGKPKGEGVNIEGLAVAGGKVWIGLRTAAADKPPYLIGAEAGRLFAAGQGRLEGSIEAIELSLGKDTGVRDLAALSDGRLLVLAGPARNESDVPYTIRVLDDPKAIPAVPRIVATLAERAGRTEDGTPETGKAETLVVLSENADAKTATVLVLYDNIDEGGPRRHVIDLK